MIASVGSVLRSSRALASSVLGPYRLLAGVPHAPGLMAANLLARLYVPAINLVLTFLVADWTGAYAAGGALAAAMTVGMTVAGPLRGRTADRVAPAKVLVVTGALFATGLVVIALLARGLLPARWWWLALPVAFLTGLAGPPLPQVGRAVWTRIEDPGARRAAFAVEATLGELVFVLGPVLAASAVALAGPFAAALGCAGWAALGPWGFAAVLHRAGVRAGAGAAGGSGGGALLVVPGFARIVCFGGLMVGAMIAIDLLLVGWARNLGRPELAGVLSAVWALGSLGGGLVLGAAPGRPNLRRRAVAAAVGMGALVPVLPPLAEPGSPLVVGVVLVVGGAAVAPMLAAVNSWLGELAPEHRRTEAFGWLAAATTGGSALASPLAGSLLDAAGPAAAAGASTCLACLAVCLLAHPQQEGSRSKRSAAHTRGP